jgi:hypothetical protein
MLLNNDVVQNESMYDVRPVSYVNSEMLAEFSIVRLPH